MMGPGSSPGHGGRSYRSFLGPVLVFPTIMRTRLFRLARIESAPHRIAHSDQQHAGDRMHRGHSAASAKSTPWISSSEQRCIVGRSEEHTSELQSLMRISYAVLCLNKKTRHILNKA